MLTALVDSSGRRPQSQNVRRPLEDVPSRPSSRADTPSSRGSSACSMRRPFLRKPLTPKGTKGPYDRTLRATLGLPRCPGVGEQGPSFAVESRELPATPRLGSEAGSLEFANLSIVDANVIAAGEVSLGNTRDMGMVVDQGQQDISDILAWIQPMKRGNYVKGLNALAMEIDEKAQDWHAYLGGRVSRRESLEAVNGEEVPPKDFTRTAEACSLIIRLVRCLPLGFAVRAMLEPLVQEILEGIFRDWPMLLPSLQDLKESEVSAERLGKLTTYAQLVEGYKASAEFAKKAQEAAEQKAAKESSAAKKQHREWEELRVKLHHVEAELDAFRVSQAKAERRAEDADEAFERFKEQTRLALSDYADMQYREQTVKSDLKKMLRENKEKEIIIQDFREQSTVLTRKKQALEDELIDVKCRLEMREDEVKLLPRLKEKLEALEQDGAVYGLSFARRLASEVYGMSIEQLCRIDVQLKPGVNENKRQTKWILDSVISRLRGFSVETDQLKQQVSKLRHEVEDVKELVPVYNEVAMQDILDAYDDEAAVHRQVFSMKDQRNFAGLPSHSGVPVYLRAEGRLVRHLYISKAECEEFMTSFHAETATTELSTEGLHNELHLHMQRKYSDPDQLLEFAYAFICSLEAYRHDPDFELFDLMLAGAVHPSVIQDQEDMLRELQNLIRNCHEREVENPSGGRSSYAGVARSASSGKVVQRERVTRRVMRGVLQAMFPEKSVERLNGLMQALNVTLQMLSDAGKSPSPESAYVPDLFAATADGTQSPLIEELRRQQVHEVLEFTAELARRMRKQAGGDSYVERDRVDDFLLIDEQSVKKVLEESCPTMHEAQLLNMMGLAWKSEEELQPVSEVLQRLRHNMLLKKDRAWIRVTTKEVVDQLLKIGPPPEAQQDTGARTASALSPPLPPGGSRRSALAMETSRSTRRVSGMAEEEEEEGGEEGFLEEEEEERDDVKAVQPRRNRAVKVLDNPAARDEKYNTPHGLLKEIQRSTPRINVTQEDEQQEDAKEVEVKKDEPTGEQEVG